MCARGVGGGSLLSIPTYSSCLLCYQLRLSAGTMADPCFPCTPPSLSLSSPLTCIHCPAPTGSPTDFTVHPVSPSSVLLSWEPPPSSQQNGIITGYLVLYQCSFWPECAATSQKLTTDTSITVHDLHPNTTYYFTVSALTRIGEGPRSHASVYDTPEESELQWLSSWSCFQLVVSCCDFYNVCGLDDWQCVIALIGRGIFIGRAVVYITHANSVILECFLGSWLSA